MWRMLVQHYGRSEVMSSLDNISAGDAADSDTRKLVILGLPWDTTEASLEQYFSQIGPLQVHSFCYLRDLLSLLAQHRISVTCVIPVRCQAA